MTLQAKCPCGTEFAVGPQLAGKRVKCSSCGQAFTVPATKPAPPVVKSQAPAPPIVARCSCGMSFQARADLAGKQVTCPTCGQVFTVPMRSTANPSINAPASPGGQSSYPTGFSSSAPYPGAAASPLAASAMGGARTLSGPTPLGMPPATQTRSRGRSAASSRNQVKLFVGLGVAGLLALFALIGLVVPVLGYLVVAAILLPSALAGVVGGFWIFAIACEEDLMCGVMWIVVPFYSLYYFMTRFTTTMPFMLVSFSLLGYFVGFVYLVIISAITGSL